MKEKMNQSDVAIERLIELLDDSNPETRKELEDLLDSKEGEEAFSFLSDVDEAATRKFHECPDIDKEWDKFETRHDAEKTERHWGTKFFHFVTSAAAILLIAFTFTKLYLKEYAPEQQTAYIPNTEKGITQENISQQNTATKHAQKQSVPVEYKTVSVPKRSTYTVTLSDGTVVCLNANSTFTYPSTFTGDKREVMLKGEGYFKVAHDPAHPFIITTDNVRTKVLGTEFNIRCYHAEDTHVTLVTGCVEVSNDKQTIEIHPNEDAKLVKGELHVEQVDVMEYIGWLNGIIHFDNATLRVILQHLCQWYDVSVVCQDKELLNKHFHYTFNNREDIEQALKLLNASSDVNATYSNGVISIQQ